jgi:hypothetical protein
METGTSNRNRNRNRLNLLNHAVFDDGMTNDGDFAPVISTKAQTPRWHGVQRRRKIAVREPVWTKRTNDGLLRNRTIDYWIETATARHGRTSRIGREEGVPNEHWYPFRSRHK